MRRKEDLEEERQSTRRIRGHPGILLTEGRAESPRDKGQGVFSLVIDSCQD